MRRSAVVTANSPVEVTSNVGSTSRELAALHTFWQLEDWVSISGATETLHARTARGGRHREMSVHSRLSFEVARVSPDYWGRLVESAAGAHLLNGAAGDLEVS